MAARSSNAVVLRSQPLGPGHKTESAVAKGKANRTSYRVSPYHSTDAPPGVQVTKEAGRKFIESGEKATIDYNPAIRERVLSTADATEVIKSLIERRSEKFEGR